MILGSLIAAALAASAPAQGICVKMGEAAGVTREWYRNAEPIALEGKKFVKYGLPRAIPMSDLEFLADYQGVPVMAERGVREHEVLYLLADAQDCSFQPYQVEAG
jgi:hypothetical protein